MIQIEIESQIKSAVHILWIPWLSLFLFDIFSLCRPTVLCYVESCMMHL